VKVWPFYDIQDLICLQPLPPGAGGNSSTLEGAAGSWTKGAGVFKGDELVTKKIFVSHTFRYAVFGIKSKNNH